MSDAFAEFALLLLIGHLTTPAAADRPHRLLRHFSAGQLAAELDGRRAQIHHTRIKVGAGGTAP